METDNMTQTELFSYLSTLADLIEAKAMTVEEAVEIVKAKANEIKPTK